MMIDFDKAVNERKIELLPMHGPILSDIKKFKVLS